jgi:S-adenosylmethionine hydrolase
MLIHLVADYGHGDLAFAEVRQRLALHLPGATVVTTPVPAFDTVSAGFCVAQLALTAGPSPRAVFHNVAPRLDTPDPRSGNQGERLVWAEVPGGVAVIGADAGHTFSFVRDQALALREVHAGVSGSQFRSRDFFPEAVARIVAGDKACLGEQLPAEAVAPLPERCVVYVDGYGNLKTSWFSPPAPSGERVEVTIGGQRALATVSDGTFEVPLGELAFAPGSSGWPTRSGEELRFFELFLRGDSAAARFGMPRAGATVDVRAAGQGGPSCP